MRDRLPRLLGRVAEWQTRWLQVPVSFGTWGFKSPFAHNERFYELPHTRSRTRKEFVTLVFGGGVWRACVEERSAVGGAC